MSISILGIISFVLTEAVISGLKTTDGTASRISGAVASQTLASYFSRDAQSAQTVATDTECMNRDSSSTTASVVIRLTWNDQGTERTASYGLDPAAGDEQELLRWSCTNSDATNYDRRVIGHFSRKSSPDQPVVATCDPDGPGPEPPAACSGAPRTITLTLKPDVSAATQELTVGRRAQ